MGELAGVRMQMLAKVLPNLFGLGRTQRLSILLYHRVLPAFDPMRPSEPTAADFEWQMALIARYMTPLSLREAMALIAKNRLPERAICVTFDDGYADNESCALPILQKHQIPATVFIASGYLNGGWMWNDVVIEAAREHIGATLDMREWGLGVHSVDTVNEAVRVAHKIINEIKYWQIDRRSAAVEYLKSLTKTLPDSLMLNDQQVQNLYRRGVEIGGHTINHPILATLNEQELVAEIGGGKEQLESIIKDQIGFFAYPNGKPGKDYLPQQSDILKKLGFVSGLSTRWGVSTRETDRWQLPRFTPWDNTPTRFFIRLMLNCRHPMSP